jgi:hypothetical protein
MAKKLLLKKMLIEDILEITGLSRDIERKLPQNSTGVQHLQWQRSH